MTKNIGVTLHTYAQKHYLVILKLGPDPMLYGIFYKKICSFKPTNLQNHKNAATKVIYKNSEF